MPAHLRVIAGPMFSGKTERLIAYIKRAQFAKKRIKILKPARDTRSAGFIASRAVRKNGSTKNVEELPAILIKTPADLKRALATDDFDVLAIDEAQFFPAGSAQDPLGWFGRGVRDLLRRRRSDQLQVIVSGLDLDAAEEPFGAMPGLMALADAVEKIAAVCMECGADNGNLTLRLVPNKAQIVVGDFREYRAVCRACHKSPKG